MKPFSLKRGLSLGAILTAALAMSGVSAYANITPVYLSSNACTAGTGAGSCFSLDGGSYNGSGFAWMYRIDLDANETINPSSNSLGNINSSYGVIYDFGPVLGVPVATSLLALSTQFTISTSNTTPSPTGVLPTDNGGLTNIVYQAKVGDNIVGPQSLGVITIISAGSSSSNRQVNFAGQAISNASGLPTGNIGLILAPNLVTPEPGTISMLLLGAMGLIAGTVNRRSRR